MLDFTLHFLIIQRNFFFFFCIAGSCLIDLFRNFNAMRLHFAMRSAFIVPHYL